MKNFIYLVLAGALIMGLFYFAFITATDRICEKPFSDEFKQSADYAAMQCE